MNKASGGDGIPVGLLRIIKDDAVKVLHSICQQILKTLQWPLDWKRSVFIPIPKKGNDKNAQTTVQLHSSHSPLDCKEIQPVHPKGDQSWVFFGRSDAEAETPILWPPHVKS